jgi:hypothetical protein
MREAELTLAVFEEFDLAEALPGFIEGLVRSSEIPALAREHLISGFDFLDHSGFSLRNIFPNIRNPASGSVYASEARVYSVTTDLTRFLG